MDDRPLHALSIFEVFDPAHPRKSVFFEDQDIAMQYAISVRSEFGIPSPKSGKSIDEHIFASVSDLVNFLNGFSESMTTRELESYVDRTQRIDNDLP